MVLASSGPIALSQIATEYGLPSTNIKMSSLYAGGSYVTVPGAPNVSTVPVNIKISNFNGAYKILAPVVTMSDWGGVVSGGATVSKDVTSSSYVITAIVTNSYTGLITNMSVIITTYVDLVDLVVNGNFTSGTTGWTSATGWELYQGISQAPVISTWDVYSGANGPAALVFSYPDGQSVTQTIQLASVTSSYTFTLEVKSQVISNALGDFWTASVSIYNSSNGLLETIGATTTQTTFDTASWTTYSYTTSLSMIDATKAVITLTGKDGGYLLGQFGPMMKNISFRSGRNLVGNGNFASGTSGWTSATGWDTAGSAPIVNTSSYPAYLIFSHPSGQSVTQTIQLTSANNYTFTLQVNSVFQNSAPDWWTASVSFYNSSNSLIQTIGATTTQFISTGTWTTYSYTTSMSMIAATKAVITLTGMDGGSWLGQYGSAMTNISLTT